MPLFVLSLSWRAPRCIYALVLWFYSMHSKGLKMPIQVVQVKTDTRTSAKTNQPYTFMDVQGVLTANDGSVSVCKHRLFPPRDAEGKTMALPSIKVGDVVEPVVSLEVDRSSAELQARIVGFVPASKGK